MENGFYTLNFQYLNFYNFRSGEIIRLSRAVVVPKKEYTYLSKLSHHVDPMVFPLMLPSGDLGWSIGHSKKPDSLEKLSTLQHYSYRLAYRPNSKNFSPLLFGGRLTQQLLLHAYIMIENNRMNFFRQCEKDLRVECYQGLFDHVINIASNVSQDFEKKRKIGKLIYITCNIHR